LTIFDYARDGIEDVLAASGYCDAEAVGVVGSPGGLAHDPLGEDEAAAVKELADLVNSKFGEE